MVDFLFGMMDDVIMFIKEVKKRNIGIMIDLVLNYILIEYFWFKKVFVGDLFYCDFYYFCLVKVDGFFLINWVFKFGGNVWEKLFDFFEYYLYLYDVM